MSANMQSLLLQKIRNGIGVVAASLLVSALFAMPAAGQAKQPVIVYTAMGVEILNEIKT